MFSVKNVQKLRTLPLKNILFRKVNTAAASHEEEIVIPKRIQRGPTDILYALAATVGKVNPILMNCF